MDNSPFFVVPFPERGPTCFKLEIRQKFAGKKIRRFFSGDNSEARAYEEGDRLTGQIREKGVSSLESNGMSVAAAVKRFWARRGPQIKGKLHRRHMERVYGDFEEKYGKRGINSIDANALVDFWNREEWPDGKSTRWQAFTYLRILFNWLERYDLVDRNPIRRVDPPTEPKPLTDIVTPEGMKELLTLPKPWEKAFVCLAGFASLRTSEALRVDPERDFNWRQKEIHVVASDDAGEVEVGGTAGERYVKMEPAFIRHCPRTFKMPNQRNFYKTLGADVKKHTTIGDLPANALRHSWFTYHLAKFKNAATTAHEGGNSEAMVKRVYALPAKRANQAKYWAI